MFGSTTYNAHICGIHDPYGNAQKSVPHKLVWTTITLKYIIFNLQRSSLKNITRTDFGEIWITVIGNLGLTQME